MVFALIVIAVFVVVSIYFYFRSERLEHDLVQQKREAKQIIKDNNKLTETLVMVAAKQEEFFLFRYNKAKEEAEQKLPIVTSDLAMIYPLVNNYAAIFRACAMGKEQLKPTTQTCFESYKAGSFKEFLKFVSSKEKHIKRMWGSNNLNGFISMMEALLTEQLGELEKMKSVTKKQASSEDTIEFKRFN